MPTKFGSRSPKLLYIERDLLRKGCSLAVSIIRIRRESEMDHSFIALLGLKIKLRQASQATRDDREHSGSGGVKSSQMTDRFLAENPTHAIHHVMRRQPRRLVDHQN